MQISLINENGFPLLFSFKYQSLYVDKCRDIKEKHGFKNMMFCKELKGWLLRYECLEDLCLSFPFMKIPENVLFEYAKYQEERNEHEHAVIRSKQTELNIDLPLFDYQKIGANFMCHNKKVMNNDEMGLGKSIQSIAVIKYYNLKNVLIVCPNSLKTNWQREIRKWINQDSFIVQDQFLSSGIQIINYEKLLKFAYEDEKNRLIVLKEHFRHFELVIFDEAHYIKEKKSKRTKIALQISRMADRVILLTGTPMLNKPREMITQIIAVDKMHVFGEEWHFLNRYCNGGSNGFGIDWNGANNIPELKSKIETFSIRRLKQDVLKDLPDKMINSTYLDLPEPKAYKLIEENAGENIVKGDEQFSLFYQSLAGLNKEQRAIEIVKKDMSGKFKGLTANVLVQIEMLKQEAARQKVIASKDLFEEYIENKKKVVVFCTHKKTVHDLHSIYPQSIEITGEVKPEDRLIRIDRFEKNPDILFLFATMQTTGTGFNLTMSSEVLFMELDWTPAAHKQCEDRCWRIGQKNNVNVNYLIANNTIDEDIIEMLNNKSEIIEGTFQGALLNKFILKILNKK